MAKLVEPNSRRSLRNSSCQASWSATKASANRHVNNSPGTASAACAPSAAWPRQRPSEFIELQPCRTRLMSGMSPRDDLKSIKSFHRKRIVNAIDEQLAHEPTVET